MKKILSRIKSKEIPKHIAIIMDGNGRWAEKKGLSRIFGHRAGTDSVREIVKAAHELGVEVLTLYAFSAENWVRPQNEVNALMDLLCEMLRKEVEELDKSRVILQALGRIEKLPQKVQQELKSAIVKLSHNRGGLLLNLALNYGGRQEIVDAVNKLIAAGIKKTDERSFSRYLYTGKLRDPDLMIRTSGERRISNFLLYQMAYSEIYVTPTLWPDFRRAELYKAIEDYQKRERRFGGT